ncbi:hypothetical protein BH09BAC1_BH09BAC1_14350 [soil metagenome]
MKTKLPTITTTPPRTRGGKRKPDNHLQKKLEEVQARIRYKSATVVKGYKFTGEIPKAKSPSDYYTNFDL